MSFDKWVNKLNEFAQQVGHEIDNLQVQETEAGFKWKTASYQGQVGEGGVSFGKIPSWGEKIGEFFKVAGLGTVVVLGSAIGAVLFPITVPALIMWLVDRNNQGALWVVGGIFAAPAVAAILALEELVPTVMQRFLG